MSRIQKKNGVTILALVITIVIMLLLAGVVLQMAMGENGLVAKSTQAKAKQAKAELYENAKISFLNLKTKALAENQPEPQAEKVLEEPEFLNKYDISGENIVDKHGNVLESKENLINTLKLLYIEGGAVQGQGTNTTGPKTVAGVQIPPADQQKMIVKLKVRKKSYLQFGALGDVSYGINSGPIKVEYEHGQEEITDLYQGIAKEYEPGEYIIKFSNITSFELGESYLAEDEGDYDVEIIQWGSVIDNDEQNYFMIENVTTIHEPEPDKIQVEYIKGKFREIPEWLFSKKVTNKYFSYFTNCTNLERIPENLFKNYTNVESFPSIFSGCTALKEIPENLFKHNVNVKTIHSMFDRCTNLERIPANLFKYNTNLEEVNRTFRGCTKITEIPENLFENNTKLKKLTMVFDGCKEIKSLPENLFKNNNQIYEITSLFAGCSIERIPENLFKNTPNITTFDGTFSGNKITEIPENLFKYNTNAINFYNTFSLNKELKTIPENLFKHNTNVKEISGVFEGCSNLERIPENLFKYNPNVTKFNSIFKECTKLTEIPENLFDNCNIVEDYDFVFGGCSRT